MSRQRLRTGVLEGSTSQCPHCQGTGIIRSTESVVLAVLRGIEDHLMKGPSSISVLTTAGVALYILNHKRAFIAEIEQRHSIFVNIQASERMQGANFAIERTSEPVVAAPRRAERSVVSMDWGFDGTEADAEEEVDDAPEMREVQEPRESGGAEDETGDGRTRSRRRRRGRGRRDERGTAPRDRAEATGDRDRGPPRERSDESRGSDSDSGSEGDTEDRRDAAFADAGPDESSADDGGERRTGDGHGRSPRSEEEGDGSRSRRRRRGRRGGRSRNRDGAPGSDGVVAGSPADPSAEQPDVDPSFRPHGEWVDLSVARRPEPQTEERAWEIKGAAQEPEAEAPSPQADDVTAPVATTGWRDAPAAPMPDRQEPEPVAPEKSAEKPAADSGELTLAAAPQEQAPDPESGPGDPPRKGWWQRRFGSN